MTNLSFKNAALIIAGHGSSVNPDSAKPTLAHAEAIRQRGIFAEVATCFWKQPPSFWETIDRVESREIYIVPNFISEGYFTRKIIPREMRLAGPVTVRDGRTIRYCDPAGKHPAMTGLLLREARAVAPDVDPARTCLVIVGHGTGLDDNSSEAARMQARRIAESGAYAEAISAYMEEPPRIADWDSLTTQPNVVVVPFFISDGLHSYQDIPVLLGLTEAPGPAASQSEVFRHNPHHLRGRRLYYGAAIGTGPGFEDILLEQVAAFAENR